MLSVLLHAVRLLYLQAGNSSSISDGGVNSSGSSGSSSSGSSGSSR